MRACHICAWGGAEGKGDEVYELTLTRLRSREQLESLQNF